MGTRFLLVYTNFHYKTNTNIQMIPLDEEDEVDEDFMKHFSDTYKEKGPFDLLVVDYRAARQFLSLMDGMGDASCPVLVTETSFDDKDERQRTHVKHKREVMKN